MTAASATGGAAALARPARGLARSIRRAVAGPAFRHVPAGLLIAGPQPTRLIASPVPLIEGDARLAQAFYKGHVTLEGRTVDVGAESVFSVVPPDAAWERALHGFGWLHNHRRSRSAIVTANAHACISDWLESHGRWHETAWTVEVAARRLASWLYNSEIVIREAPPGLRQEVMASIGRHLRFVILAADGIRDPVERLSVRIAVTLAALSLDDCERLLARSVRALARELEAQILPDGGHLSRNPSRLVRLLGELVPLRNLFAARSLEQPQSLIFSIERMLPMLRMMCHGDGGLALFNGAGDPEFGAVSRLLDTDRTRGRALAQARHSGYHRLAAGASVVVFDTGMQHAHPAAPRQNGPAAFELSDGAHRIVVNCGCPGDDAQGDWQDVARSTAAHSTVTLNDRTVGDPAIFRLGRTLARLLGRGPGEASHPERRDGAAGSIVEAANDGYLRRYGITHDRRLFLNQAGDDLRGEDILARQGETLFAGRGDGDRFTIRFHLHPSVRATRAKDGTSVLLGLPNHVGWRFNAAGAETDLEDSVYFGDGDTPRRTKQIVVHGVVGDRAVIKWAFKKLGRQTRRPGDGKAAGPELPLETPA